jgi:hypothetical protein
VQFGTDVVNELHHKLCVFYNRECKSVSKVAVNEFINFVTFSSLTLDSPLL